MNDEKDSQGSKPENPFVSIEYNPIMIVLWDYYRQASDYSQT